MRIDEVNETPDFSYLLKIGSIFDCARPQVTHKRHVSADSIRLGVDNKGTRRVRCQGEYVEVIDRENTRRELGKLIKRTNKIQYA